jgi:hypothetical protein
LLPIDTVCVEAIVNPFSVPTEVRAEEVDVLVSRVAPPLGMLVPFTDRTFGKAVVAEVINEPLVGIVTVLIEVMPVGVVLRPIVIPEVPPFQVVPEENARLPPAVRPREFVRLPAEPVMLIAVGMSAATRARKDGVLFEPLGAAKTKFAVLEP